MRTTFITLLIVLFDFTSEVSAADESLQKTLEKRTLNAMVTWGPTLPEALLQLVESYKSKYGDELSIYISVGVPSKPAMPQPGQVPLNADGQPRDPVVTELANSPVVEILRYYGAFYNAQVTVQGGLILFHKIPNQPPQRRPKRPAGAPDIPGLEDFYEPCVTDDHNPRLALQRTWPLCFGCDPRVTRAGLLSLGR